MIPFPAWLQRRSSWPSSFVTALIGWNGFATIAALALGREPPAAWLIPPLGSLLLTASTCAVLQVLMLRARLRYARRPDSLVRGGLAGAATALPLGAGTMCLFPILTWAFPIVFLIAAYIGAAVGAFLSYFARDDARIEAAARAQGHPVDYGRDAHWLDPFAYGAATYLIAFLPSVDAAVAMVGAMVGVVAAGVSHFFLARFDNRAATIPIAALAGAPLGMATGLLLRNAAHPALPAPIAGALAGALCFAVTAAVGRTLAVRERTHAR